MRSVVGVGLLFMALAAGLGVDSVDAAAKTWPERPNIILAMADDQGYGDAGHMGHPTIETPVLDEMAASGLRFDRFYAAAPVCTPTRASVLTGRHPNRMGAFQWGDAIRSQEQTIAEALQKAGYRTGHFGKWHLGAMIAEAPTSPGQNGFDTWLSAYNFYDNDPYMSRNGHAMQVEGESSMIAAEAAVDFMQKAKADDKPFLAVVWFGSPHLPHRATEQLKSLYPDQSDRMSHYLGEITGIDQAMGRLREKVRDMGIAAQTMVWYCSDNGGKKPVANNGPLRGQKGQLWEGGIRVPAIIEWPGHLEGRVTDVSANTSDIYPTLLDLVGVEVEHQPQPLDGTSLVPVLKQKRAERDKAMGFWDYPIRGRSTPNWTWMPKLQKAQQQGETPEARLPVRHTTDKAYPKAKKRAGWAAWIDGDWKLHRRRNGRYELYNLRNDLKEQHNVIDDYPERARRMKKALAKWQRSVHQSLRGADCGTNN
jgi:arylsulfatase A-like enzyme